MSQAMDTTDTHVAFGGHDVNAYEHPWQVKRLLMIRIFPSASKWPEIPDPLQTSCQNFLCCPVSLLIVRSQWLSWIQVLNCSKCQQCCTSSKALSCFCHDLCICICLHLWSSIRSCLLITLIICLWSSIRSCLLITLIICLKGHEFLHLPFCLCIYLFLGQVMSPHQSYQ